MAAEAVVGLWLAVAVGLASTLPVDIADYRAAKGRRRGVSELIFRCLFLCFAMLALCDALGSNKPTSNIPRLSSLLIRQGDPEQPSIDKPTTPPTTAPPATTAAAGTGGTAGSDGKSGGSNGGVRTGRNDDDQPTYIKPTLDECGAALQRMQVVLLLELLFECIAVIAVCLLSRDKNAKKFLRMWSTTLLLIYVIPVILLNVSVIWLGGAPTGSCLNYHTEVRLAYTHLLLYMTFKIAMAIVGISRSKLWQSMIGKKDGKSAGDDPCAAASSPRAQSNWGRGDKDEGVPPDIASDGYTMEYQYMSEEAPKWDCTCCGIFRFVP